MGVDTLMSREGHVEEVGVYIDQINQAHEQVTREIYENTAIVELNPDVRDIDDFTFDDIAVKGYDKYHPAIRYPVAI